MRSIFKIEGLDCANCALNLERAIEKVDGVNSVSINFMMETMELNYESDKDEIIKRVKKVIKKEEDDVEIFER